jgi:hypothetical protein
MNIKGLLGNMIPTLPISATARADRAIKSDSTSDRDANGQQAGGGEQQHREPMTEEQIEKAMEHLRSIPGVKDHGWEVELSVIENKKFIIVKDTNGTIIRRIPELDLWTLQPDSQPGKGQLLKKTA